MFTYDTTAASSFKLYLKKAIKDLIFSHEEVEESRSTKKNGQQTIAISDPSASSNEQMKLNNNMMVPFLIVGMKKDRKEKQRVPREEAQSLLKVLKKHIKCDMSLVSAEDPNDISQALHRLMSLASSHLFPHYQHLNMCTSDAFSEDNY